MDKLQIENLPVFSQNVFNGESGSRELLRFSSLKDSPYYCSIPYNLEQDAIAVSTGVLEGNATKGGMGVESCCRVGWGDLGIGGESLETNPIKRSESRWSRSWDSLDSSILHHERISGTLPDPADGDAWGTHVGGTTGDCRMLFKEGLPMPPHCGTFASSSTSKTSANLHLAGTISQSIHLLNFSDQRNFGREESCSEEHGSNENRGKGSEYEGLQDMTVMAAESEGNESPVIQFEIGCGNTSASFPRMLERRTMLNQGDGSGCSVGLTGEESKEVLDNTEGIEEKETQRTRTVSAIMDEESVIGLKLGKRTYFEDMAVGGSKTAGPSTSSSSPQGKKQKSLSPTLNVSRCQVEGCIADLQNFKEYYRRHKVCESHSKAVKVKVADKVQRFCQQCSRFHDLNKFDEGKRSCRRRLAGHNERRRKPQPEMVPLLPGGNYSFPSADDKQLSTGFFEHSCYLQHPQAALPLSALDQVSLACMLHGTNANSQSFSALPQPASDQVLLLLQSPEVPVGNLKCLELHQFMQETGLSKPTGASLPAIEALPATQSLLGISGSGRALSLLSSCLGSLNTPCSTSTGLSPSPLSLEQFLTQNEAISAQPFVTNTTMECPSCFGHTSENLMTMPSQSHAWNATNMVVPCCVHEIAQEQLKLPAITDCDNVSMLEMLQGQELHGFLGMGSLHGQHTIN